LRCLQRLTRFPLAPATPDGRIGTLSRPASASGIQTETADDFILGHATSITNATFYGLIPTGTPLSSISEVEIEFYHVFPGESANPPSGNVPSRTNSPGDVEIDSATRDSADGSLTFGSTAVSSGFGVLNTVVNGINKIPNEFTNGEGPATGDEVLISVDFTTPVDLPADHYFFRPEALLSGGGNFLFLSAAGPPLFTGDLQSWTRNDDLAPDWLRIGTDITHQGPFDAAFSLTGTVVPEPSTWAMMLLGFAGLAFVGYRASRRTGAAA
jgi:PEP-CTERM motif